MQALPKLKSLFDDRCSLFAVRFFLLERRTTNARRPTPNLGKAPPF